MSITIDQVPQIFRRNLRCGINFSLHSEPARAKTSVLTQVAERLIYEKKMDFWSVWNGGSLSPLDLSATIPNMTTGTLDRIHYGALPNFYDTPNLIGAVYIGEKGLVGLEANRQLQKVINHEPYGDHKRPMMTPPGVIFVMDSNLITDKSGVQAQSRAVDSRSEHYVLRWEVEPYLRYAQANFHPKLGAFLMRNPGQLDNYGVVFNPKQEPNSVMALEGKHGVWANMRTWDRLSRKLFDADTTGEALLPEEMNCVGVQCATMFRTHLTLLDNLASIEDIIANPKKAEVPKASDGQFALSYMLSLMVRSTTFKPVVTYMRRMSNELQVVFLVSMNDRFMGEAKTSKDGATSNDAQKIFDSQEYVDWTEDPKIGGPLLAQLTR